MKKKTLPQRTREYVNLIKQCYAEGYRPLKVAIREASRRWAQGKGIQK